jgi:hypothetical protein
MIKIDLEQGTVIVEGTTGTREYKLDTPEAFQIVSDAWLRAGWDNKYVYSFTWLGRPIIQLPEDMIRLQEVIHAIQPDVILETGVAHGGALVFYASLCKAMDRGRVIGVDVEIRPHNREAIESHSLAPLITLIQRGKVANQTGRNGDGDARRVTSKAARARGTGGLFDARESRLVHHRDGRHYGKPGRRAALAGRLDVEQSAAGGARVRRQQS